ncbi:hypothetical protein RhiirA1_387000 [Rhizophagus irregularis]|uniref:20S-pre-rRNA D-site endonuclease NOB1 n=1 Tax=Rhizophagus irregularis TaxID=588596 RepID=A0A2N0SJT9_9GLOM|nr:hypothetical protein RhiirA1_387000 [Rhizophagus irregularis]
MGVNTKDVTPEIQQLEARIIMGTTMTDFGSAMDLVFNSPLSSFCPSKRLVIDSGPLIKGINVRAFAEKIYTIPEVISEIRDKHSRDFLNQISFDLQIKVPSDEALREVVNFSKKTGDFASLSAVDLRVLALTYMLEVETNGTKRLKKEPVKEQQQRIDEPNLVSNLESLKLADITVEFSSSEGTDHQRDAECAHRDEEYDDDDIGWITPDNIDDYQAKEHEFPIDLKKDIITTNTEKKFCPNCGNAALIRTSTSTDANGNVTYYLKKNFQYNLRGTKYSIPEPKSGRNANNIILREDQKEYQKALKNQRKQKEIDIFDPDYIPKLLIGISNSNSISPVIGYGRRKPKGEKSDKKFLQNVKPL